MRKFIALGALAAMAAGAQAAESEGFSYNLIEGSYAFADFEGIDADGFGVQGSGELTDMLHAFGSLRNLDVDGGGELDMLSAGLGANFPISPALDFIAAGSFERLKSGSSESGWGVSGGLRGMVGTNFELAGSIKYSDVGDVGDVMTYTAGGRYYFTPNFALGGDYTRWDFDGGVEADAWIVSLRYDFGSRF
jgi:hypothetical protein